MREINARESSEAATFAACLATILELPLEAVPHPRPGEDVAGWRISRWLGGLGIGLVAVADARVSPGRAVDRPRPAGRLRTAAARS